MDVESENEKCGVTGVCEQSPVVLEANESVCQRKCLDKVNEKNSGEDKCAKEEEVCEETVEDGTNDGCCKTNEAQVLDESKKEESLPPAVYEKNVDSETNCVSTEKAADEGGHSSSTGQEIGETSSKNIHYEGDLAIYTDPSSGYQYTWSKEKEEWVPRTSSITYGFEDDTHTYTDAEGVKYFWDKEKKAWFPKLDDEFMAIYQLNYGFVDNTQEKKEEEPKPVEQPLEKVVAVKRKAEKVEPKWFEMDDQFNTKVYVSNLPTDITEQDFVDLMQKCGLVMRDPSSGKMKVKIYTEPRTDVPKGDALCTYIRIESVDLALKLLDGSEFKGKKIKVERAKFQMKGGSYDPKLKPKKPRKKEQDKLKKMQAKLFDWRPEKLRGERAKHERIVIVKNLFVPSMFDVDVGLILEFQQDLREECSKYGEVRKVSLYDQHPEGVAQINMKDADEAERVVQLLNGRWFGKRQLRADIWDGKTKYKIAETDSQISQRLDKWDEFLEATDADKKSLQIVDSSNSNS